MTPLLAAGVDGCPSGWIAALGFGTRDRLDRTALRRFRTAADLVRWCERQPGHHAVAIDVPIGLPARLGDRPCDREARRLLGRRQCCVFQPPDRELLDLAHQTHEAARARIHERRLREPEAGGLTRQGFGILPKIAEVDLLIRADPRRQDWLVEAHPEVSFRELAGRNLPPKRGSAGRDARREQLGERFHGLADRLQTAAWRRQEVGIDDLLDAYAALWSALRFRRGENLILGDGTRDREGIVMRIVV